MSNQVFDLFAYFCSDFGIIQQKNKKKIQNFKIIFFRFFVKLYIIGVCILNVMLSTYDFSHFSRQFRLSFFQF